MSHPAMPANTWEPLLRRPPSVPRPAASAHKPTAPALGQQAIATGVDHGTPRCWEAGRGIDLLLVCSPGLFADGFAELLGDLGEEIQVRPCAPDSVFSRCGAPDLVVVDMDAVGSKSAHTVQQVLSEFDVPVVLVASSLQNARRTTEQLSGVKVYLSKSATKWEALGVIRQVLDDACSRPQPPAAKAPDAEPGGDETELSSHRPSAANPYGLTRSEMKVLTLLCEGLPNLGIARRLGIQEGTVKIHLNKAYEKMGVQNRTQAVKLAERLDAIRDLQLERAETGVSLLDWLLPHMTHEVRRAGEVLFHKGDLGHTLYYIQQGRVALREIGKVMGDGELLGEIGIFAPEHVRTCTAVCEAETRLFRITAEQAKRLYLENPRFAYHVLQLIAQRLLADRARPE